MRTTLASLFAMLGALSANSVRAETALEQGFSGALRGCEEWVLNPKSWIEGAAPFISTVGLGDKMTSVGQIEDVSRPPKPLRAGNRYWRINSTPTAGYILVVSDELPMCHITGGGETDLLPAIDAVLSSRDFNNRWEPLREQKRGGLVTTTYRSRQEPEFSMIISHPVETPKKLDRIQVIATATLAIGK